MSTITGSTAARGGRAPRLAVIIAAGVVVVTSCAGSAPTVTGAATVTVVPAVHQVWGGGTVEIEPPPAGVRPQISAAAALATCGSGGSVCGGPTSSGPVISIGLATSAGAGNAGSNGALLPLMDRALVYQMVWRGERCIASAPATGSPPPAVNASERSLEFATCTTVSWVDGTTGKNLYAMSGPAIG